MKDNSWKDRVKEELIELDKKIIKLNRFIESDDVVNGKIDLSDEQYELLVAQVYAMSSYRQILTLRLYMKENK